MYSVLSVCGRYLNIFKNVDVVGMLFWRYPGTSGLILGERLVSFKLWELTARVKLRYAFCRLSRIGRCRFQPPAKINPTYQTVQFIADSSGETIIWPIRGGWVTVVCLSMSART